MASGNLSKAGLLKLKASVNKSVNGAIKDLGSQMGGWGDALLPWVKDGKEMASVRINIAKIKGR